MVMLSENVANKTKWNHKNTKSNQLHFKLQLQACQTEPIKATQNIKQQLIFQSGFFHIIRKSALGIYNQISFTSPILNFLKFYAR